MSEDKGHYWTQFIEGFEARWKVAPECPFCGSNMKKLENWWNRLTGFGPRQHFYISCNMCGARGADGDTPDLALDNWSRRQSSSWVPLGPHSYVLPSQKLGTVLVWDDMKNVSFIDYLDEEIQEQVDVNLGHFRLCYRHRGEKEEKE